VVSPERKRWQAVFRLLERDERVFAGLLALAMVGGLATIGLIPLRPRYRIDLISLVFWFAAYKVGVFALVTVKPQATRKIFLGALAVDLVLVFILLYLTGGGDSFYYALFYPLVGVNGYYFGPRIAGVAALAAGALFALAAWLVPPWVGWPSVLFLSVSAGLPAVSLGHVAERERHAREEVDQLNLELTGTLTRLQATQHELLVSERMAAVGRVSLKVAHEVRNPISAIELNAEMLQEIVGGQPGPEMEEAKHLVSAIRDQVSALDAITEEYLAFARFPRPQFEEESINDLVTELAEFVRPLAVRQGLTVLVETEPGLPMLEIDRGLLRQAILNLVKNAFEALSRGGRVTLTSHLAGEAVEIAVSDSGPGISPAVAQRLFEQFFTTKPQGTGLGLGITRQIIDEHGGEIHWANGADGGVTFTISLPVKRAINV
jgi:signal transduction histidine kinase